jgi:ethanolaminephosphotransferase
MRITKKQLAGVDQYKYSGVDKSVLSKYVLGPFWTWLVTLFPRSLAPNTVSGGVYLVKGLARTMDASGMSL